MNYTAAIFLINSSVRAVSCVYDPEERKTGPWVFKTMDASLKKDDLVIVPTHTRHGFTTPSTRGRRRRS